MKIKQGFFVQDVCGEHVVMAAGSENMNFNKIISINETAYTAWQAAGNSDFTAEDLAAALVKEYEVDEPTALKDVTTLISQWREQGLLEE